ncbi:MULTISPECIES: aspartate--tRNA ligase [unclassified Fusibacter]|uniref:aspartate--tRNA ligase n=1 Tax=unclassified Fusibacter TaxID=2624464 RepID=UPI001012979A|nr:MULTISPECIES: aspartate--tRNA ligase [unclassified Fusibacter]MCK8059029.1 aspartate--tRNA ligase [Fusibacter sp. A2]NPE22440.1 aspartate--tRNA ligase [Fusibacter sp. A1]RXV60545.1 aspartate--tRNA ligase [Fusibacter sp. A1]
MAEFLGTWKRTHYSGVLREEHIGQEVILMGWVQKKRNLGGLIFVDLRDREGISQIIFDSAVSEESFNKADQLTGECVIAVKGIVHKRESINESIPTGLVEVYGAELKILSFSQTPPIHINDDDNAGDQLKLKYRYLDLRKPKMQNFLKTRHKISSTIRDFLNREGFLDMETPVLTKPTPEGARDYLVPSRVHPGKFYALPQSPQLFKQLLMISGFDKYYQIVRCFRDEDLRADRQPEFTQVDIEMSFIDQEDIMAVNEKLMGELFKSVLGLELESKFMRMTYAEAMDKYGSDKPDLRFGMEMVKLNDLVADCGFSVFEDTVRDGHLVKAINVIGGAEAYSKKAMKNLEKTAKTYGAKGLAWLKVTEEGIDSPIAKFMTEEKIASIIEAMDAKVGDMVLFIADKKSVTNVTLGGLRLEAAKKLDLIDPNDIKVLWVVDFPLFEYDEDDGRFYAKHHPFTSPMEEDLDIIESDPENARAKAYDLVINGSEVGGGSIRIYDAELQNRMFKALGLTEEEITDKFGFLVEALKYGTPPHGGIAYGLDRLTMILTGTENIRDVIAFPKTQNAACPLTNAPSPADAAQLEELALAVVLKEKEEKTEE